MLEKLSSIFVCVHKVCGAGNHLNRRWLPYIYICINEGKLSEVSSSLFEPKLGNLDSNNIFQGKNGWNGMRVLPLREVIYTL